MPPEIKPDNLNVNYQDERLRKWREKRAKVAEKSQQERLRIAEVERQKRLEAFEKDKAKRIREAAEKRAEEIATQKAERMNAARAKIATRTDIDAARKRIKHYRIKAARMMALRLALFVLAPTLLVGLYLFNVATPLYVAETKFTLTDMGTTDATVTNTPFATDALAREAFHVQALIQSPQMIDWLDRNNAFIDHFSGEEFDPITRVKTPGSLIPPQTRPILLKSSHHQQARRPPYSRAN